MEAVFRNPVHEALLRCVAQKTFVLAGKFKTPKGKDVIAATIEDLKGIVKTAVTAKTDYVIVGSANGKNHDYDSLSVQVKKAIGFELNLVSDVEIISEESFLQYLSARNIPLSSKRPKSMRPKVRSQNKNVSPDNIVLTEGQKKFLDMAKSGANIYLGGLGGTGKSYVIERFLEESKNSGKNVIACAPTGIAALNIGGSTIHRVLGIRPDKTLEPDPRIEIDRDSPLLSADIIVVDEISMCRIDLFEYLSLSLKKAKRMRARKKKAGHIQLIVAGDFCQLPPVVTKNDEPILRHRYGDDIGKGYPFLSPEWESWNFHRIELDEAIRQKDASFIEALNKCREGDTEGLRWIEEHAAKIEPSGAVMLYGRNREVEETNAKMLESIQAPSKLYTANVNGKVEPSDMPTSRLLELKEGARVMALTNNSRSTYMNGSLGTIVQCGKRFVDVMFDNSSVVRVEPYEWQITRPVLTDGRIVNKTIGTYRQIPLKLAYAITIHKSQGQTFDKVSVDPECWDPGQLYTALSRATSIEGLHLKNPCKDSSLITSDAVLEFYKHGQNCATIKD
ncbi:MAG: AAA family ATPase [Eggerthellaceae bacterium]|nr:AAA family ATPase [Eggerthellaceae bacterium]